MSASNFIGILFTEHNIPEVNVNAMEQQTAKIEAVEVCAYNIPCGKREKRLDFDEKKALHSIYCIATKIYLISLEYLNLSILVCYY